MCNCCNLSREHSLWTVCFHIPDLQTVCGRSRIVQLWIHLFRLTGAGGAKEKRPVVRSNHRPFVTCRPHTLGGKATKLTEALSWCLVKSLSVKAGEAGRTRLWMCRHSSASQKLPALPLTPVWSRQQAGWPCAGQTSGDRRSIWRGASGAYRGSKAVVAQEVPRCCVKCSLLLQLPHLCCLLIFIVEALRS